MPDRHKHLPISFRPPEADRAWLEAYAGQTGQPLRAILAEALARYRAEIEAIRYPACSRPFYCALLRKD